MNFKEFTDLLLSEIIFQIDSSKSLAMAAATCQMAAMVLFSSFEPSLLTILRPKPPFSSFFPAGLSDTLMDLRIFLVTCREAQRSPATCWHLTSAMVIAAFEGDCPYKVYWQVSLPSLKVILSPHWSAGVWQEAGERALYRVIAHPVCKREGKDRNRMKSR